MILLAILHYQKVSQVHLSYSLGFKNWLDEIDLGSCVVILLEQAITWVCHLIHEVFLNE